MPRPSPSHPATPHRATLFDVFLSSKLTQLLQRFILNDQVPLQLADGTQLSWQGPSPAPIQYGGIAGFGANDNGTNLTQPAEGDRYTHYFRREFKLDQAITQVEFQYVVDDGAVVYIDGVEIFRPGCCVPVNTPPRFQDLSSASGNELSIFLISPDLPPDLILDAGTHTIAVEVHQRDPASSDLGLDFVLHNIITGCHSEVPFRGRKNLSDARRNAGLFGLMTVECQNAMATGRLGKACGRNYIGSA